MKLNKGVFAIVALIVQMNGFGQNINRPAPNSSNTYEFIRTDTTAQNKYFLVAPFNYSVNGPSIPKNLYVIDENGYIAWWSDFNKRQFDFKYHPGHDEYLFTRKLSSGQDVYHYQMDANFNVTDSIKTVNGVDGDIHEFQIFPNGNRCIIGTNDTVVDMSSTLINGTLGSANTNVIEIVIQEFDGSGNLVFEWKSLDHFGGEYYAPGLVYNSSSFDYLHTNAVELDSDGNLMLSCRAANMVCKIDHQTGDIIWRLGGHFSDFTFINDSGFLGQHDIRRLSNGNVSVFDNDSPNNVSARGVVYELDTNNWTATMVSETSYGFDFPARSLGSYRVLDNDYSIAGWGNTNRPSPSTTLFDDEGNVATDIIFKDSIVSYRSFFQEIPSFPTRPSIECQIAGNDLLLSVSGSHNDYLWSTGETTATITISQTGTYQCWVDQGIGMLGSYEAIYADLSTCSQADLPSLIKGKSEVVKYTDIMGRTINHAPKNQVYIIHYANGFQERKFEIDN